jgi:hypothetical protein
MHQLGGAPGLASPFCHRRRRLSNAPTACCHRAQGPAAIESPADYEAIASISSPFLTHLSLELPASATALPHQLTGVLSACSKLEDLAIRAYDEAKPGVQ